MKIAQVAPLFESVPPQLYGGTERVVSYLTEELVSQGHDVTLFASGDSVTKAQLVSCSPRALRLDKSCRDTLPHSVVELEQVFQQATGFDIIHFHIDYLHFPLCVRNRIVHVTTQHGRLDLPDLVPLFQTYPRVPVVSISTAQREPLPWLSWAATVYHGLPEALYTCSDKPGNYLAFLGRLSPEKGVEQAIEISRRSGMPLKIVAKIDDLNVDYYEHALKPLFKTSDVEYLGEMAEPEKNRFLSQAHALVFPIDWPEPFGLVMIEAMACGTPVVSYRRGSVPEIVDDGVTGFIVDGLDQAVQAVKRIPDLNRQQVRRVFEERFSAKRMTRDYLRVYRWLIERGVDRTAA